MTQKQILRSTLKAKRLALLPDFISAQSWLFCSRIQSFFADKPKQNIGIYLAGKGELDLAPSIAWLSSQGHHLYAPVIQNESLHFHEYTATTPLTPNQFGLLEPVSQLTLAPQDLDYVLIPLVAFDKQGHRLGMGKGYYDRTFAFHKPDQKPLLIGCAYAFQEVPLIPHERHDVHMDLILTTRQS